MSQLEFLYTSCKKRQNVIRYGAGKLANVKEILNGVVGIARFTRFGFRFTVRLAPAAASIKKKKKLAQNNTKNVFQVS